MPLQKDGRVIGTFGISRDITDRKRAEEALRASEERIRLILDTANDAFIVIDSDGCIKEWNLQAETTFGWPRAEVLGKPLADTIIPERFREAHTRGLAHFLASGQGPVLNQRIELAALRRDGSEFPVELTITPIRLGPGYIFSSFLHDITNRKQAEEALRRNAEELARSNEEIKQSHRLLQKAHEDLKSTQSQLVQSEKLASLGQLVAGVAHEINNPLSFVSNNTAVLQRDIKSLRELLELLRQGEPALAERMPELSARVRALEERIDLGYTLPNIEEMILRSRDGLKRIQQIVKDLRDFARLDESDLHEVDINEGVESTINIIRGRAKKQQVEIELDLEPLPLVSCFPAKVNQVVMNLIANAIDASNPNTKVLVQTKRAEGGVEIHVIDQGRGVDPKVREKIFDPFITTKPFGQGTGLGLSISYGIVRDHGGRIWFDSQVGAGAHFAVFLPLKPRCVAEAQLAK
jgi:PAS domain S-box-containing protein